MNTPFASRIRLVGTLAITLFLLIVGCSSSRDAAPASDRVVRQLAAIDQAVDLTDEQSARIRDLLTAAEADRPAQPQRGQQGQRSARGDDPRAEQQSRQAETDRLIEAVLTPDQVERYRTWRAAQPQRGRGERPRGGGPRTGN